jgi:hypothetical protein
MKRPNENRLEIDDVCVYTIISPERLRAANNGKSLLEKTRWVTAKKMFQQGRKLPIILANARNCQELLAWSVLTRVEVTETGTVFAMTRLYDLRSLRRGSLTVLSTRKPIPNSHIRPYVICKTPRLLKALAKRPVSARVG